MITKNDVYFIADKCSNLRIFEDAEDKMNISVKDVDGEVLIISQFTLYGETAKGNRPNFTEQQNPTKQFHFMKNLLQELKKT